MAEGKKPDFVGLKRIISNVDRFLGEASISWEDVEDMAEIKTWLLSLATSVEQEEKKYVVANEAAKS